MHSQWKNMHVQWRNCGLSESCCCLHWDGFLFAADRVIHLKLTNLWFHQFLLSTMRTIQHAQSTLLPTMLYTHNCTGIITIRKERLKYEEMAGRGVLICWVAKLSWWAHPWSTLTVRPHSTPSPLAKWEWGKKKVNDIEEGGNPCYPRLQLGDVDHSAPHKVHKHTGFNVSVNALQIPSLPLLALLTPPLHVFQQSERYSKM